MLNDLTKSNEEGLSSKANERKRQLVRVWVPAMGTSHASLVPGSILVTRDIRQDIPPFSYAFQVYDTVSECRVALNHHKRWNPGDICALGVQPTGEAAVMIVKPCSGKPVFVIHDLRNNPLTRLVGSWDTNIDDPLHALDRLMDVSPGDRANRIAECFSADMADPAVTRSLLRLIINQIPGAAVFLPEQGDISRVIEDILAPIEGGFVPDMASSRGRVQAGAAKIRKFSKSMTEKLAIDILAHGEGRMI